MNRSGISVPSLAPPRLLDVIRASRIHRAVIYLGVIGAAASMLSGCAFQSFEDSCSFPADVTFYDSDPESLTVFVASPEPSSSRQPFLRLSDSGEDQTLTIQLTETSMPSGNSFIGPGIRCSNTELRQYDLGVSAEDWISFWDKAEEDGQFRGVIGFPSGKFGFVRTDSIGFALIDKPTAAAAWTCGCLTE